MKCLIFVFRAISLMSFIYSAPGYQNVRELRSIGDGDENVGTGGVSPSSFRDESQYIERSPYYHRTSQPENEVTSFPQQHHRGQYSDGYYDGQFLGGYWLPHDDTRLPPPTPHYDWPPTPPPHHGGQPPPPSPHDDGSPPPHHRMLRQDYGAAPPPHYGRPPPPHHGGPQPPHDGGQSQHSKRSPRGPPPNHRGPPPHSRGPPPHAGGPPPHSRGPPPHAGGPPPHRGGPPHSRGSPPRPPHDEPEQDYWYATPQHHAMPQINFDETTSLQPHHDKPQKNGRPHNNHEETNGEVDEANQYTQNGDHQSNNREQNKTKRIPSSTNKPSTTTTENSNNMLDIRFSDGTKASKIKNFVGSRSPYHFQASAVTPATD